MRRARAARGVERAAARGASRARVRARLGGMLPLVARHARVARSLESDAASASAVDDDGALERSIARNRRRETLEAVGCGDSTDVF